MAGVGRRQARRRTGGTEEAGRPAPPARGGARGAKPSPGRPEAPAAKDRRSGAPPATLQALKAELRRLRHERALMEHDRALERADLLAIQQEMEASRLAWADLYQSAPVGYATLDAKGCLHDLNERARLLLGLRQRRINNSPLLPLLSREDRRPWLAALARLRGGRSAEESLEMHAARNPDAVLRFYFLKSAPGGAARPWMRLAIEDATREAQAVADLKASERKFRDVFESSPIAMALIGLDGRFLGVNPAALALHGYTSGEKLIGKPWLEQVDPSDRPALARHRAEALQSGSIRGMELAQRRSDGTPIRTLVSMARLDDASGQPASLLVMSADITALRLADEQLAADLDAMVRLQKLGTLFVREGNLESVLSEVVEAAVAITQAPCGEILLLDPAAGGLRIAAHRGFPGWWPEYWSSPGRGRAVCDAALKRGERVIVEDLERSPLFAGTPDLDVQRRAGIRAVQSTPLVSRSGAPLGMFSTCFRTPHRPDDRVLRLLDLLARQAADMIERAAIEAAMHASEERFRRAIENAPIPVIMHAEDGQVLQINRTWTELTGYTYEDMPSFASWLNRAYGEGSEEVRAHLQELFRGRKQTLNIEFAVRTRDDHRRYWNFSASVPGVLADGRRFVVGMAVDITERKQAEDEIHRRAEELKSLNEELTRFNRAMVGRELRMVDLKRQVNGLAQRLGEPAPYTLPAEEGATLDGGDPAAG